MWIPFAISSQTLAECFEGITSVAPTSSCKAVVTEVSSRCWGIVASTPHANASCWRLVKVFRSESRWEARWSSAYLFLQPLALYLVASHEFLHLLKMLADDIELLLQRSPVRHDTPLHYRSISVAMPQTV